MQPYQYPARPCWWMYYFNKEDKGPKVAKAVVPCQNKIILTNFRPQPPPSVDRPKIILYYSMEPRLKLV